MNKRVSIIYIVLACTLLLTACAPAIKTPSAAPSSTPAIASPSPEAAPPEVSPAPAPSDAPSPEPEASPERELEPAPDFTLTDLDGNTVSLSDFKDQVVVLNFWASWCGPCKKEMPDFELMHQELQESGAATLLSINLTDGQRETEKTARAFVEEGGYTFPVLLDTEDAAAQAYRIYSIPTTFIINKEGRIAAWAEGAVTKEAVLAAIEDLP